MPRELLSSGPDARRRGRKAEAEAFLTEFETEAEDEAASLKCQVFFMRFMTPIKFKSPRMCFLVREAYGLHVPCV
jgi:hypothetical protein